MTDKELKRIYEKECSRCHSIKSKNDFYKDSDNRACDGFDEKGEVK